MSFQGKGAAKEAMKRVRKLIISFLCLTSLIVCTMVCIYEVYNSYLSSDPKNLVTYHQAYATGSNADYLIKNSGIATSGDATATDEIANRK